MCSITKHLKKSYASASLGKFFPANPTFCILDQLGSSDILACCPLWHSARVRGMVEHRARAFLWMNVKKR